MNAAPRYDPVAMSLHWLLAVAILGSVCSGLYASGLPISPARLRWVNWHKWLGIAVLFGSGVRLLWRMRRRAPDLPPRVLAHMSSWQRAAHAWSHRVMYLLFLAVPLAGWAYSSAAGFPIVWLGVLPLPDWVAADKTLAAALRTAHQALVYGLCALVALHVAAVVKHQWFDRDGLLQRMLPQRRMLP